MKQLPKYHFRQEFLNGKLSAKSIAETTHKFKYTYDYSNLSANLPEIFNIDERLVDVIWGGLFPQSLDELGASTPYYFAAKDVVHEINWVAVQVAKNKEKIIDFIEYRNKVFNLILLGKYDTAEYELEECRKNLGLSVWYYEMRILIYGLNGKEKDIFELLETVNDVAQKATSKGKTGLVPHLLQLLYLRSSAGKVTTFENELKRIEKLGRNHFYAERLNYFKHRLNYYSTIEEVNLASPLVFEAPNALVDRYGTLLTVLRSIFVKEENNRDWISEEAYRLYKLVKDPQLLPMVAYKMEELPNEYYHNAFLDILDCYYEQQYDDVIQMCKVFVQTHPCHLNNLRLYVQTLIIEKKAYTPIYPGRNSLINEITRDLYAILTEQDSDTPLIALCSLNKRLYGLPIAGEIYSFICEQIDNRSLPILDYIWIDAFDPLYSKIWNEDCVELSKDKSISYLKQGVEKGNDGITVKYYQSLYSDEAAPKSIALYRLERDLAVKAFNEEKYEECIEICQSLLARYPHLLSIGQMAVGYIFRCFEVLDRKMDAITFYVEQYIEKQSLTNRVHLDGFVRQLRDSRYKGLRNNLDLQIFVLLNAAEEEQKAHVLEMFMNFKNINDAEELVAEMKREENQIRVESFLNLLLDGDVMRHLSYIESTSQMLKEQQTIASFLTELESEWHKYYVDYSKKLLEQTLIYVNTGKLDESRIYVNKDALVKYDLNIFETQYSQLKEIEDTMKRVPSTLVVNFAKEPYPDTYDSEIIGDAIQTTKNASMDVAVQLFDSICNKYLFSKFGLKTYLSTRIRHGVLEGELRSVFDSHNLVLLTEGARYRPIDYWRKTYGLKNEEQEKLMIILADFSKELLHNIEMLKEEVVQIKTNEGEKGMLNYILSEESKCYFVYNALSRTSDYKEFCYLLISSLNKVTEQSLVKIRDYIKNNLAYDFNKIIENLENHLSCFINCHFYSDIQQAVTDTRAELQGKLVKIEHWFTLQATKFDDFELDGVLKLVWEVTSRQYPNIHFHCKFDTNDAKVIFAARYYLLVSDILTILYNNIFNHGEAQERNEVLIATRLNNTDLFLHIENPTKKTDDELNEEIKKSMESDRFQNEVGSGLAKVKNIVVNEFDGTEEDIRVKAENGKCKVDMVFHLNKLAYNNENIIS